MNPKGNENNSGYLSLSILSVVADIIDFSKDWKRYVNLELDLTNQANALLTIVKGMFHNNKCFYIFWYKAP
jgi:hypothetical protein